MDLLSTVRKTGSRGGVNFSWDDVASSSHRQNYLGHSLKAPVGRWQQGRDLTWYAKADEAAPVPGETDEERKARERREELRKVKEAEEDAISRALGLPVAQRDVTGANAIEVGEPRVVNQAAQGGGEEEKPPAEARESRGRQEGRRRERQEPQQEPGEEAGEGQVAAQKA